jgi:hypothetical protein
MVSSWLVAGHSCNVIITLMNLLLVLEGFVTVRLTIDIVIHYLNGIIGYYLYSLGHSQE